MNEQGPSAARHGGQSTLNPTPVTTMKNTLENCKPISITADGILRYAREQGIADSWDGLNELNRTIEGMLYLFYGKECMDSFYQYWEDPSSIYYAIYPYNCNFESIYVWIDTYNPFNLPLTNKLCFTAGPLMLIYMMSTAQLMGWRMPHYKPSSITEEYMQKYQLPTEHTAD